MGGFAIDYAHDSEEVVGLKKHIANQENKCAGLEDRLLRCGREQREMQDSLNETIEKLRREADGAVELGLALEKRNEELARERMMRQNLELLNQNSGQQLQSDAGARRELQATLEAVAAREAAANRALGDAARDKAAQDLRIRVLEANVEQLAAATAPKRRGRASSLSGIHLASLERELAETRAAAARSEAAAAQAENRAAQARSDVVRIENDAAAMERRLRADVQEARERATEQLEELGFFRAQQGAGAAREEELMQRIELEEAKVASMEKLLASSRDMSRLEDELADTHNKFKAELARARGMEDRQAQLAHERDEGLRLLAEARGRIERISETLRSREADILSFEAREKEFNVRLQRLSSENDALKDNNCSSSEKDAYVEKLLNSVTRIRGERDGLRRDLDFLQAETRFTIQGLKKKVQDSSAQLEEVNGLRARVSELESRTDVRTPADHAILSRLSLLSTASIVVAARLGSLRDDAIDSLARAREELHSRQSSHDELLTSTNATREQQMADFQHTIEELQERLDACSSELAESNIRRDELEAMVGQLQSQVKDLQSISRSARSEQSQMHIDLEEKKRELAEFTRALENVESERDTLSTQVMTLRHDLDQAREDIKRGDERYTALQAQQLSSLPSDGVASALRKQLEEYKDRVERRNEQIGKHQHEIQRLEATQRLQEDRLTELNDELDVAMTEKESMIEDCAEAREARDEALQRVEELEEELESAEAAAQKMQDQHTQASAGLIRVWASAVNGRRTATTRLSAAMRNIQAQHANALRQLQVVEEQRSLTASVSDARASQLEAASNDARAARAEAEQTDVALGVSQSSLRRIEQLLTTERDARTELDAQLAFAREELDTRAAEVSALQARLEDLRDEKLSLSSTSEAHVARVEALRSRISGLEETLRDTQGREEAARQELTTVEESLRQSREREASQIVATRALEAEIEDLRQKHSTELEQALARLETVTANLEGAQSEREAEANARDVLANELTAEKAALELRVQELLVQLEATSQSSENIEADHAKEVELLTQEVALASNEVREARAELEALRSSHAQQLAEVSDAKAGLESRIAELEASIRTSEEAFDHADALHAEELAVATEKVTGLESSLQALQGRLDEEDKRHIEELQASRETQQRCARRFEEAQARLAELQDEMEVLQGSLTEAQEGLKTVSEQRVALEEQNIALQANAERLDSAHQQAQASQRELEAARSEIAQLRLDVEQSRNLVNNAQLQLDLQVTEHRCTLDGLHRQIAQLKSRASEGGVVRELQEQLRDMDVLMSKKNEEIEGNDDRVMSLLKENKKLGDKVTKLIRKVETLQKKLAVAKEAAAAAPPPPSNPTPATPTPSIASASSSVTAPVQPNGFAGPAAPPAPVASGSTWTPPVLAEGRSSTRVSPPVPVASSSYAPSAPVPPVEVPPTPRSRARLSSSNGLMAQTRPKTPERRFPTVFRRAKTPEPPRRSSPPEDKQPTSTLGKRRADDIDDQVPAQGFTSEGTMDPRELVTFGEATPRARKSVRTGFTPVRNTTSRPAITVNAAQRSPERRHIAPMHISDVTNSPRGSAAHVRATTEPTAAANKPGKWVNRLKSSTNGAPSARTVSTMRSFFEKSS